MQNRKEHREVSFGCSTSSQCHVVSIGGISKSSFCFRFPRTFLSSRGCIHACQTVVRLKYEFVRRRAGTDAKQVLHLSNEHSSVAVRIRTISTRKVNEYRTGAVRMLRTRSDRLVAPDLAN